MRYRKKPVVVEAFQMTKTNRGDLDAWPQWLHDAAKLADGLIGAVRWRRAGGAFSMEIATLEGLLRVRTDDWIIRDVHGSLYPCKPDIFEQTYEPVDSAEAP